MVHFIIHWRLFADDGTLYYTLRAQLGGDGTLYCTLAAQLGYAGGSVSGWGRTLCYILVAQFAAEGRRLY